VELRGQHTAPGLEHLEITDAAGDVVARVRREVYVREKRRVTDATAA
jgi:hypothetical protein